MNSLKKICDGKPSIALKAMVIGLQKDSIRQDYVIKMNTFGEFSQGICFGCAATSALQELTGKIFTDYQIVNPATRATFLGLDPKEAFNFDVAMDFARSGKMEKLFKFTGNDYNDQYDDRFFLGTYNWQVSLPQVEDLITELEAQGL